jgi:hypothetical protein
MNLKTIGCLVVGVLIVGFYVVIGYGPQLGLVTPVNHTATAMGDQDITVVNDSIMINGSWVSLDSRQASDYLISIGIWPAPTTIKNFTKKYNLSEVV